MSDTLEFSGQCEEFSKAFLEAQKKWKPLKKESENPYFSSKYADLESVIDAVLPALNEAGIALFQGAALSGGEVRVETRLVHTSGQWVRNLLGLRMSKDDPQGEGSAITYGRRYGLQAICGIAPEDDDGNAASAKKDAQQGGKPRENSVPVPLPADPRDIETFEGTLHDVWEFQGWTCGVVKGIKFSTSRPEIAGLMKEYKGKVVRATLKKMVVAGGKTKFRPQSIEILPESPNESESPEYHEDTNENEGQSVPVFLCLGLK